MDVHVCLVFLLNCVLSNMSKKATFSIIDDYIFLLLYIYIQFPNIYLGLEYVGPSKRMLTGLPIHIFFAFGLLYIAGMGYFLRNWFYVQLVVGVPFAVFLLYWW